MCAGHDPQPGPDRLRTFEEIYVQAGRDFTAIPWAALAPHPALVAWLDRRPPPAGDPALIVGCGLGDDAEEAARRGYQVTAFDLSPTAIGDCRDRFPGSAVDYQVADLFQLAAGWAARFALAVEIRTLQSLPLPQRGGHRGHGSDGPAGRAGLRALPRPRRRRSAGHASLAGEPPRTGRLCCGGPEGDRVRRPARDPAEREDFHGRVYAAGARLTRESDRSPRGRPSPGAGPPRIPDLG